MTTPSSGHAIVVGASAAGLSAADGLREGGFTGRITVLAEELAAPYDRPVLSKGLLAGPADAPPVPLRTEEQLREGSIDLQLGHAAVGLDIDRKIVVTSYGEAMFYDHVVIASGARARPVLATDGTALPTLRTLDDLAALRAVITTGEPVTVVGAGFIGLEVAAALRAHGTEVILMGSVRNPLGKVVGDEVSAWLRDLHASHGVHLGHPARTVQVTRLDSGYEVLLDDGSVHHAVHVVAGVGAEPVTDWLIGSGVELDGAVVVDETGRTNVPDVWAAGDVAARRDPATGELRRFEHWTYAVEQGRHVGLSIARGDAAAFTTVPYLWTEQYGHTLHILGQRLPGDQDAVLEGDIATGDFVVAHGTGDELHAVTVCGRVRALRTYKRLLRSGAPMAAALEAAAPA